MGVSVNMGISVVVGVDEISTVAVGMMVEVDGWQAVRTMMIARKEINRCIRFIPFTDS